MTGPTPGPWSTEDTEIFAADGVRIAATAPVPGDKCAPENRWFGETELANARLLATAPKLLAGCRASIQALEHHAAVLIGAERIAAEHRLGQVRAAIAEAEGRLCQ